MLKRRRHFNCLNNTKLKLQLIFKAIYIRKLEKKKMQLAIFKNYLQLVVKMEKKN